MTTLKQAEGCVVEEIGFRFYCQEYVVDQLLPVKIERVTPTFASLIHSRLAPAVKRFWDNGLFIVRVLDDHNLGVLRASWLDGKSMDANVLLMHDNGKTKVQGSPSNAVRLLSPKSVRETFERDTEKVAPGTWERAESVVVPLIDLLYQEQLAVCVADPVNTLALHAILKETHDYDLRIRLKGD